MTAVMDQEASQDIELAAAQIDDYEDIEVSSMSEDSDDEQSRPKTKKRVSARASSSIMPRRSFYSARFESIPPVPQSFPPQPPSPKPSQSSFEQAPRRDQAANLGRPESSRSCPSDSSLRRAFAHDWIWELTFLLIAIISLLAIVLILFLYNGRPVLDLPRAISVNAILAIFSTSMTAALSVPLALSISQAKWDWFHGDQGGGNPLSDLEIYDQASRGPWGALVMLGKIRWRHFSSLGAVIIVLTLATDCTIQQTISYQLRLAASPSRALSKPTLPISRDYNDRGSIEIWNSMTRAIYSGFLGIPATNVLPAAFCPSGECTWQAYETLAVCSLCKNETAPHEPAEAFCSEEPAYPGVGPSVCIYQYNYAAPPTTRFFDTRIYYSKSIVGKRGQSGKTKPDPQAGQTYHCSLFWCVRSFSSAKATGGILVETPEESPNLTSMEDDRVRIVGDRISSSAQLPAGDNLSNSASNRANFTVDESSSLNLSQQLYSRFFILDSISSFLTDPDPVFKNIADAISAQLRTIPFYTSSSSSSSSSSNSPLNITNTTTTTFVAPGGTAFYQGPVLIVHWAWLAFPVFLLFGTTLFLFFIIITARNPVWKDSLWPLLVLLARPRQQGAMRIGEGQGQGQGLGLGLSQGQGQGQGQGWGGAVGDMKRIAGVRVRLQRGGRGEWGFTSGQEAE